MWGENFGKPMKINGEVKSELIIPADFVLVSSETHERDGEQVKAERYQKNQEIIPNNAHVTVIFGCRWAINQL